MYFYCYFTTGQYGNVPPLGELKEDADGVQHSFEDVSLWTFLVALLVITNRYICI